MTKVTVENIKKISRLARIEVQESDLQSLANQVGNIINWVEKLNELEVNDVDPLTSVHEMQLFLNEDKIADGNISEDILRNAKNAKYGYFSVPKVIE